MKALKYVIIDVFSERALEGNPLAVFTNGAGLPPERMQALAREMNLSETVFVLPPEQGGHAKIRIFTPQRELPFAGHPTLGSAIVVGQPLQMDDLCLETGKGLVQIRLEREGGRLVFGWMTQPLPSYEPYSRATELFAALGVTGSKLPPTVYDNGARHVYVMLGTKAEVADLEPDLRQLRELGDFGINVFAGEGYEYKTRMFAPFHGIAEDPATGSAAGPLAVHLARYGVVPFGKIIRIEQGVELGRPSVLHAVAEGNATQLEAVRVGGAAVIVARGEFRI